MLRNFVLFFVVCMFFAVPATAATPASRAYGKLDTKALEIMLRSPTPPVMLDARKPRYDDGERIGNAVLMPPGTSAEEIARVVPNKDTLIVTYCSHMRCPLSHELAEDLIGKGYRNVLVYPYGLKGWKEAGLSLKRAN
ncbi:MAG: rhodanese-like domain-containing protein [Chlamydiia bacterium]|nr:rhodanese-like domain-containing protein [Chlamydiia bacterium]